MQTPRMHYTGGEDFVALLYLYFCMFLAFPLTSSEHDAIEISLMTRNPNYSKENDFNLDYCSHSNPVQSVWSTAYAI